MNRTNKVLVVLLIIQVVLAIIVWRPQTETKATGEALLSDFSADAITRVEIQDDTDNEVILVKNDAGEWVLDNYDDYPVNSTRVTSLLDKLVELKSGRLITQSETSHRRLNVASDTFLRRIHLEGDGDTDYVVFIGNSGGGNATHVRVNEEEPVYLVDNLRASDANTTLSSWIDLTYFTVSPQDVVSVTVENPNGTFEFVKDGETWTMTSPEADRESDPIKISSFVNQVATLRMQEPISRAVDETYGLDSPQASVTIQVQEPVEDDNPDDEVVPEPIITTYTYQIGSEQEEAEGYVAKSSESEYYVRITATTADGIIDKTVDNFLVEPPQSPTPPLTPDAAEEHSE